VTNRDQFQPWLTGQWLMKAMYELLGKNFEWKKPPYEYVYDQLPIDVINGTDVIRKWIENNGSFQELTEINNQATSEFKKIHQNYFLY
jgi:uncharacterized protein YbbC (DUF1343 family)